MPNGKKTATTTVVVEERRHRVADLFLQGLTQNQIAAIVGVSQGRVSTDLKAMRERWREDYTQTIHDLKLRQIAELDRVAREAWSEWEKSKGQRKKASRTEAGGEARVYTEIVDQCGDPQYLTQIREVISQRCKILGIQEGVTNNGPTFSVTVNNPYVGQVGGKNVDGVESMAIALELLARKAQGCVEGGGIIDVPGSTNDGRDTRGEAAAPMGQSETGSLPIPKFA